MKVGELHNHLFEMLMLLRVSTGFCPYSGNFKDSKFFKHRDSKYMIQHHLKTVQFFIHHDSN